MRKILIVDDSLLDRKLLINVIKKAALNNDIFQAANGQEGLKLLSENLSDIGIVLLDWQMPVMDGIEFMRKLRQVSETAQVPVVMITASGSEDNKRIAYGVNPELLGYIVKPYKPEQVLEIIKPLLLP